MHEKDVVFGIVLSCSVFCALTIVLVLFYMYYQRNKNKYIKEKEDQELRHKNALMQSELEIQEQTLKHIGYELHDNIGQLITVAKIHSNALTKLYPTEHSLQAYDAISQALEELRALSKVLDHSQWIQESFEHILLRDRRRINQLGSMECIVSKEGEEPIIDSNIKIIIYRMIQEIITNAIKHSQCSVLNIQMIFKPDLICFHISDNGIGFDMNEVNNNPNSGSGLLHILQRIKVIGGSIDIVSNPEQGTLFKITYPIH